MARRALAAAILSLVFPYLILSRFGPLPEHLRAYWLCLGMAFASYWYGCVEGRFSLSETQVLFLGLMGRIMLLPMPPSDDIYRFIWEGKVLAHGFSPYALAPDHPYLAFLRDADWARINHPHIPTIYPPIAQAAFGFLAVLGPRVIVFKLGFIAFDVLAFLALRGILKAREGATDGARILAVYFLNPLLLFEIAGRGHYDSLPILCNLLFLGLLGARAWAPALLGLGALAKLSSLALTPLLLFRLRWKRALAWGIGLGAAVGCALWAVGAFDVLRRFAIRFRFNGAVPTLIDLGLPFLSAPSRRLASLALFALSVAACAWIFRRAAPERQALVFTGLLLLFSPTLHPWYVLWLLPFAALTLNRPWLLLSATSLISYEVYARAAASGLWHENAWLRLPEFLAPLALWLWLLWRDRARRRAVP